MNKDELKKIESKIKEVQDKIKSINEILKPIKSNQLNELLLNEKPQLEKRFLLACIILVVIILITLFGIGFNSYLGIGLFWVCVFSGILGSSTSALISALQRRANGLEFQNGIKYPSEQPKDKFSMRISIFFILRPLLGVIGSIIVFYGFESIFNFEKAEIKPDDSKLILLSLLAGLFAKSLIEKLKNVFDNIIGK